MAVCESVQYWITTSTAGATAVERSLVGARETHTCHLGGRPHALARVERQLVGVERADGSVGALAAGGPRRGARQAAVLVEQVVHLVLEVGRQPRLEGLGRVGHRLGRLAHPAKTIRHQRAVLAQI